MTKPIRSSRGVGCAVGLGVAATGCARGLVGVGLPAAFAVGLELLGDARRTGAFFADDLDPIRVQTKRMGYFNPSVLARLDLDAHVSVSASILSAIAGTMLKAHSVGAVMPSCSTMPPCPDSRRTGLGARLTQRRGLQSCSGFMVKCEGNGRGPGPTVTRCHRECVGASQRAKNKSLFSNYCCCDDC